MNKRVLIADDHLVVRLGISVALQAEYPNLTIDMAESYEEVMVSLQNHSYFLVILDISMAGIQSTRIISELKNIQKDVKILIFTSYDQNIGLQYIRKGAEGYLHKKCNEQELKKGIKNMFEKGCHYPSQLIPELVKSSRETPVLESLTKREYQIFELLAEGGGNLEISNQLGIKESTVSTIKRNIFKKIKIQNIAELIEMHSNLH